MPPDQPRDKSNGADQPRPRGRPLRLTDEIQEKIVTFVRAGAMRHSAAQAAGVPERTFYEWMERGRGQHRTRRATPRLRAFAQAVDQAHAEARVGAEIRIYRENAKHWLTHAARSRPDSDGWTQLRENREGLTSSGSTLEERIRQFRERGLEPPD